MVEFVPKSDGGQSLSNGSFRYLTLDKFTSSYLKNNIFC